MDFYCLLLGKFPQHSHICWPSGLFRPYLEGSTKYCLERDMESSVRLCLTSCKSSCSLPIHLAHLPARLGANTPETLPRGRQSRSRNCAQRGADPPLVTGGGHNELQWRPPRWSTVRYSGGRMSETAPGLGFLGGSAGHGSPQNLPLFCHNSSELQLHFAAHSPCTPTYRTVHDL